MGILINAAALERELARRGWTSRDLARAAGLCDATVSMARSGRPVSPATLRLMAAALAKAPALAEIDSLLL
ncbi:MAG TPA: hypothetical protein VKV21_14095 [Solirubrobacteraceae bacterium]|nr:hypothetical protein [Solirubrobacteraceae bacterium]